MKTIEIIGESLIYIIILLLIFGFYIQFKPFKIGFKSVGAGFASLLIIIGITWLMALNSYKSYKKGIDEGSESIMELLKEKFSKKDTL